MTRSAAVQPINRTAPAVGRMTLGNVVRGKQPRPLRVILYGVEGVGKSSFAAQAPSPIFLCAEDGTAHLDVARFPTPTTWLEAFDAVAALIKDKHEFQTLVIDTLDWLEPLCWAHVCAQGGKSNIEDFNYGRGFLMALDEWRTFMGRLDQLMKQTKMNVILLGHAMVKKIDDPQTGPFDRYRMKLHERAADLWREWVDAVLFARHEVFAVEKKGKMRGVSSGARVIHTEWSAAFDAKNRFDLPETLPLGWIELAEAIEAGSKMKALQSRRDLELDIPRLPEGEQEKARKAMIEWAGEDAVRLSQLHDRVKVKIAEATALAPVDETSATEEPAS